MLKKRYIYDVDSCAIREFFPNVVLPTTRIFSYSFPQSEYSAFYQPLYDGKYSLVIASLPPYFCMLKNDNYLVHYISMTFDCYREMFEFLRFIFVPFVYSFDKVYKYKRKIFSTKTLIYNYKRFIDYAINVVE